MKKFKLVLAVVAAISFTAGVSNACNAQYKGDRNVVTAAPLAKNNNEVIGTNGVPVRSATYQGPAIH